MLVSEDVCADYSYRFAWTKYYDGRFYPSWVLHTVQTPTEGKWHCVLWYFGCIFSGPVPPTAFALAPASDVRLGKDSVAFEYQGEFRQTVPLLVGLQSASRTPDSDIELVFRAHETALKTLLERELAIGGPAAWAKQAAPLDEEYPAVKHAIKFGKDRIATPGTVTRHTITGCISPHSLRDIIDWLAVNVFDLPHIADHSFSLREKTKLEQHLLDGSVVLGHAINLILAARMHASDSVGRETRYHIYHVQASPDVVLAGDYLQHLENAAELQHFRSLQATAMLQFMEEFSDPVLDGPRGPHDTN